MRTTRLFATLLALLLATTAAAETRSFTVKGGSAAAPVPVSLDLLTVRNTIGADFAFDWSSLQVLVGGAAVPHQIDDTDLNGRVSAGDELSFVAAGDATVQVSDEPGEASSAAPAFEVGQDGDATVIKSLTTEGFQVTVAADGLASITGFGAVTDTLAAELGILRFSGFPESTYWANGELGPHEEYTTLEAGGMRHVRTEVLPAGPVRVTVVSEYASDRFVGLNQRVVTRVFATGDVDVSNDVTFRGYSDMMKLQHMVTTVMSQADQDATHVLPVFRRLLWADQLGVSAQDYFAERDAIQDVDGTPVIAFPASSNASPLYWGAAYIFASAEPWRANYSDALDIVVIESAHATPAIADDYDEWLSGNTWVFESQEFRTGVFKWTADEFATYDATKDMALNAANHYLPGDAVQFHYTYSVRNASDLADAVRQARSIQQGLAGVAIE